MSTVTPFTPPAPAPSQSNPAATVAFWLGLAAALFGLIPVVNFLSALMAIAALVVAIVGLVKARTLRTGRGLAIWGLVLALLTFVIVPSVNAAVFNAWDTGTTAAQEQAAAEAPADEPVTEPETEPETPTFTEQDMADLAAADYLDYGAYSEQGLIDQLSSKFGDGYPVDVAEKAVADLDADWDAEAVESAADYLDYGGYSEQGLIDQLSSEHADQFTEQQATDAVTSLDVDWNAEAVESATSYLDYSSYSCTGLIDQLSSEYGDRFTTEQATYAATTVGLCE